MLGYQTNMECKQARKKESGMFFAYRATNSELRSVKKADEVAGDSTKYIYQQERKRTVFFADVRPKCKKHPTSKSYMKNSRVLLIPNIFIDQTTFQEKLHTKALRYIIEAK